MNAFSKRPKSLMCYICGREYGTKSLGIHLKTCMKKWEIEQNNKPKKDRRPMPKPPKGLYELLDKSTLRDIGWNDIEQYNEKANDNYTNESLIRCPWCNRTFMESRMAGHNKICFKDKPLNPLPNKPVKNTGGGGGGNYGGGGGGGNYGGVGGKGNDGSNYGGGNYGGGGGGNHGGGGGGNHGGGGGGIINKTAKYNIPDYDEEEPQDMGDLVECSYCGRNFASDRVGKHEKICQKSKKKKVKVKLFHKPPEKEPKKPNKAGKEPKWKNQHNELVQAMQYMRKIKKIEEEGGDIRKIKPPPTVTHDDLIPCPYCGRTYNEKAAERHIPKCKDIINKPKPPPKKNNYAGGTSTKVPSKTTSNQGGIGGKSGMGGMGGYGGTGGGGMGGYGGTGGGGMGGYGGTGGGMGGYGGIGGVVGKGATGGKGMTGGIGGTGGYGGVGSKTNVTTQPKPKIQSQQYAPKTNNSKKNMPFNY